MKITDYESVTDLNPMDVMLVDGERGTKTIRAEDFSNAVNDISMGAINHRNVWRGKNLGSSVTDDQIQAIRDGTFKGLYIGDYWFINNRTWRIADFDYWYNFSDDTTNRLLKHHAVMVPDETIGSGSYYSTDSTNGAYMQSIMYNTTLPALTTQVVQPCFPGMMITHPELLHNQVRNPGSYPIGAAWAWINTVLMNEPMVFGSHFYTQMSPALTTPLVQLPYMTGIDTSQLAMFRLNRSMLVAQPAWFWLREVATASQFAVVSSSGYPNVRAASASSGVRPCFAIG